MDTNIVTFLLPVIMGPHNQHLSNMYMSNLQAQTFMDSKSKQN